jgi:MYXO-CTERM domain-containing protein
MCKMVLALTCAAAAVGLSAPVQAQFISVDMSPYRNSTNLDYVNGTTLPVGSQSYNGVPFELPGSNAPGTQYAWVASRHPGDNPRIVDVAVGVFGADKVHNLMNTVWGSTSQGLIAVEFIGSGGLSHYVELLGGTDIRDYNQSVFTNSLGGGRGMAAFDNGAGQRIDMLTFDLPEIFRERTLEKIKVFDFGDTGVSRTMLTAVTVEANPIPAPGAAGALAAAGILAARRRRR